MSQEGRFCKIPLIRLLGAVTTELISSFTSTLESTMDWQGQKLAEHLMQLMLVSFAVVAFIVGYVLGSFQTMLLIYAAGVVLTSLIIIPNWPFFNRHPLNWLDSSEAEKHPKPQAANSGPKKKASKK
ncbi:probable signal peptidase complex subunit 1 isoform X2 [Olea europaea var. sylvestris]|uniref:probable signal peptidase complex subunit 1 isoform X2 n=1 Tax=Olea europaea var. sylvestris TaxID=158386 RepID=UPI000C1CD56E|nr:probable signal peptidase complex subunit 1 isoform X2 [Olea europaea var. sylvestris]